MQLARSRHALGLGSTVLVTLALAAACGSSTKSKATPDGGGGEGGVAAGGRGGEGPRADAGTGATPSAGAGAGGEGGAAEPCPEPTGEGTTHEKFVSKNETWTAADSPHTLPDGAVIDATVTVEDCAVVRVGASGDLAVSGALVTLGTAGRGVRIERLEQEAWGAISSTTTGGRLDLEYTSISGGGAVPANGIALQQGMITVEGERELPPDPRLRLRHVKLINSNSQGILLTNNAAFSDDSTDLSVTGSVGYPVLIGARAVGTLPPGAYDDNSLGAILIGTFERLGAGENDDVTLHQRGVAYQVGSEGDTFGLEVGIGNGNAASLTIEPGVELRFGSGFGLSVEGPDGVLSAVGTAAAPIVFTSAAETPAAGDWLGLSFFGEVAAKTQLDHTVIAFAGSENTSTRSFSCGTPLAPPTLQAQTMGAVYLALDSAPTASFITNTLMSDSASNGVDRGYTGDAIDFTAGNQFERIAYCVQTEPKPAVGACSAEPACPQVE